MSWEVFPLQFSGCFLGLVCVPYILGRIDQWSQGAWSSVYGKILNYSFSLFNWLRIYFFFFLLSFGRLSFKEFVCFIWIVKLTDLELLITFLYSPFNVCKFTFSFLTLMFASFPSPPPISLARVLTVLLKEPAFAFVDLIIKSKQTVF